MRRAAHSPRRSPTSSSTWSVPVLAAAMALLAAAPLDAATVRLRGGGQPVAAERVDLELAGVRVVKAGVTSFIAWDQVQAIEDRPLSAAERGQLATATDLWRARSRVQRGDEALAVELFQKHFTTFRGTTSETALVVAEGLLRCRLASGLRADRLKAIVAAIEVARLRRAKVTTDRYAGLVPVIDEATLLCPYLGPDLAPALATLGTGGERPGVIDPESEAVAAEIDRTFPDSAAPGVDGETLRTARLYAAFLRGGAGPAPARRDEGGLALLAAMVELGRAATTAPTGDAAATSTVETRTRHRAAALAAAKALPGWAAGWAHFAVGRSLVAEQEPARRVDGVLELLEVAAIERQVPTALVNQALLLGLVSLRSSGDAASAAVIERELAGRGVAAPSATNRNARGATSANRSAQPTAPASDTPTARPAEPAPEAPAPPAAAPPVPSGSAPSTP